MSAELRKEVLAELRRDHDAECRRLQVRIAVLALLFGLVYVGSYWLSSELSEFDAPRVCEIAREKVEAELPGLGESLSTAAEDSAPDVVAGFREQLLALPAALRAQTQEALLRGVHNGLAELDALLGRGVDELSASVQQMLSQDGLGARVEEAAVRVEQGYERELDAVLARLSGRVDAVAARTVEHLQRLQSNELLSPREQLERRLIQTSLALYGPLDK